MVPLILKELWALRTIAIFILTPIVLLPIPIVIGNQAAKCAYVLILMAVYWTLEIVPIAVTGLMPVLLFPLLGILKANDVAVSYISSSVILFLGGLMVATAVEHWNLHRRIALNMILLFGAAPHRLMLGVMVPTWFLSMWISNTATTAMMCPIALSITEQLGETDSDDISMDTLNETEKDMSSNDAARKQVQQLIIREVNDIKNNAEDDSTAELGLKNHTETFQIQKALLLCIAYAANIGGPGSLIGTGPNILFYQMIGDMYEGANMTSPISFASWFMLGLPVSFTCMIIAWFWLQIIFLRCRGFLTCKEDAHNAKIRKVVKDEMDKLGSFSFAEGAVLVHFIVMALLWFLHTPQFIDGWSVLFKPKFSSNACAGVLVTLSLFVFPSKIPRIFCCRNDESDQKVSPLLTWPIVHKGVPWMVIWLIGGGLALAKGAKASGLNDWIGMQMSLMGHLQPWAILIIITLITATVTELTSNTAITAIFLPILADMCRRINVHPIYIMFPAVISASFAFMLPVATPPNAIVYSTGKLKLLDMIKTGFILNILCVGILNIGANTWAIPAFNLENYPEALRNVTL